MSKVQKYSTMAILLIPIGIAINYVGGQLALVLKLPVFIDVIGTILVGALAGPLFGGITGLVTNLILGITAPVWIAYAVVNVAIGIVAGLCAQRGWFKDVKGIIITSVLIWLITQLTANPVTVYMFGGVTGSGSSFITSFLLATGQSLWQSVITTALITETVDKFVSVIIVFFIIKAIPARTLTKFPLGEQYIPE
ncbi:MAG TPA: ECF transporter S component [Erysipelotrichaceae bacterium]|nr:ECF transporter S component [Erysipelotrichaceae bacterium]